MVKGTEIDYADITIEELVKKALELRSRGNIGIAYTYNEPLIGYEFVKDCSTLAKENGLKNVAVTNGYICEDPLRELLPTIDALILTLRALEGVYTKIKGNLDTVKNTIIIAAEHCHVEVTTLIIPGENDSEEEMEALSDWLGSISPDIPLHISRFFPRWKVTDKEATPVRTVYRQAEVARRKLKYVYEGNC